MAPLRRASKKVPAWWLAGRDAHACQSTILAASCRNLQRVLGRFAARETRLTALEARFEASLGGDSSALHSASRRFDAPLEAFSSARRITWARFC
eukprot:6159229-Pyramimonas_sp.AAC.1